MIETQESPHGFEKIVPDAWHEYFRRELGRNMDEFELRTLERMKQDLEKANAKLLRRGLVKMIHPAEDMLPIFIDRVREQEAKSVTRKIMVGYTGGRRDASN